MPFLTTVRHSLLFVLTVGCVSSLFADANTEKAWGIIRAGLSDANSDRRAKAVQVLGLVPHDSYAEALALNSLRDPEPRVRAAAAAALGQMGATGAIPQLKEKLNDPEGVVVFAAGDALVLLKDPAGYEIDYEVLMRERKSGASLREQERDLLNHPKELEKLGIEEGIGFIPYGGMSMTAFRLLTKDTITPARAKAARALGKDPDPKSGWALAKSINDEKWLVRVAVAAGIAERNDPSLLPPVVDAMDDKNDLARDTAAAAVIHLSALPPGQLDGPSPSGAKASR